MANTSGIPKSTPKDVFMHLLAIVALYASVISFITLLWQFINAWIPDPLTYNTQFTSQKVQWSSSVLLVMYPVYVLMTWLINKDFFKNPSKRDLSIRKWLVYLTLFISALTVIIDLITLIYNFLGGDLTLQFFFKILAVLITAASVFGYYLWDMRKGNKSSPKLLKILGWAVSVMVLSAVIGAFFTIGSPARQRKMRIDSQRVYDLQNLQVSILNYYLQHSKLPENLTELSNSTPGFVTPIDPVNSSSYQYTVDSNLLFTLCANFDLPSQEKFSEPRPYFPTYYDLTAGDWRHEEGQVCFQRDANNYKQVPTKP